VWSAIATMLATINISSVKDDQGRAINFTPEFSTGLSRYLISRRALPSSITDSFIAAAAQPFLAEFRHVLIYIQNLWTPCELPCNMGCGVLQEDATVFFHGFGCTVTITYLPSRPIPFPTMNYSLRHTRKNPRWCSRRQWDKWKLKSISILL